MNLRLVSALMLSLTLASCGPPGNAQIKQAVKAKVQSLNDATIQGEYAKVAELSHPKIIELAGGREKLIALIDQSMKMMKQQGIELRSSKVGEPSEIVRRDDELFVVVPFDLTLKYPDGERTSSTYVIGVSADRGEKWTFVNSSSGDAIKEILPNLPAELKLPDRKQPVIEKE